MVGQSIWSKPSGKVSRLASPLEQLMKLLRMVGSVNGRTADDVNHRARARATQLPGPARRVTPTGGVGVRWNQGRSP